MLPTSQIRRALSEAASMRRIADIPGAEEFASRGALGRRVCREFGSTDGRGRPQLAGCLKALNVIVRRSDRIVLPAQRSGLPSRSCTSCRGERYAGRGRIHSCQDASACSTGQAGTNGPHRGGWNATGGRRRPSSFPRDSRRRAGRVAQPVGNQAAPTPLPSALARAARSDLICHAGCSPDGGRAPQPHSLNPQMWHFTQPSS